MEERSKFWKLFGGSSLVTVVAALKAFTINKLLAVFLPPAAFACVGQFMNLMTMGQATSSLALQNGWVSLTAQNKDDEKSLLGIWRGGVRLTTFATVFTCIVAILFCFIAPLETILPGIPKRLAQAAILFALPGIVAANWVSICTSVMNGLGDYRRWAVIGIGSSIIQCVWVAWFLYTGMLSVLSIVATQSIVAAIFAHQISAKAGFKLRRVWSSLLDDRKPWGSYALMGIIPMILTPIVLTFIRSMVGTKLGWDAAGIWQGIWKISDFFATGFSAVLGVIILPKVSRSISRENFSKMFNPLLLRIFGITFVAVLAIYFLRGWIVPLFLSSAYIGAVDYMPMQLIGDFFRAGGWAFGLVLIARRETKIYLTMEIGSNIFLATAAYFGIRFFEFSGPMMAYAAENFLYFVIMFVIVRRLKWSTP